MGLALEVVAGAATAPGATLTNWTVATGNSLTIRNTPFDSRIQLLQAWGFHNVAGRFTLRSPKLHDNVQGIRMFITATDPKPLLTFRGKQMLVPQDTLVAQESGSAVGGQTEIGAFLVWYENLPGADGRFIDEATLNARFVNYTGVEVTNTPTASATYSGEVAINSSFDNFKANTDYAVLGYTVSAACAVVGLRGVDTGNLRVAGPGDVNGRHYTCEWFVRMSRFFQMPLVPVFNAANRFAVLCDIVQNQANTAVTTTWYLAELAPVAGGRA